MVRAMSAAQRATLIKPGEVRNPNGRPKKVLTAQEAFERRVKNDLRAAAKEFSPQALRTLVEIMNDTNVAAQHRLSAANSVLDRAHGKPTNHTDVSVGVYDRMSDKELIKFLTGKDITGEVIEHESGDDDSSNESYDDSELPSSSDDELRWEREP